MAGDACQVDPNESQLKLLRTLRFDFGKPTNHTKELHILLGAVFGDDRGRLPPPSALAVASTLLKV
jgi:hypothetical protein